ncbi:MAG: hypothetical protein ACRDQH_00885 [Pseudonocardiaceae bacterium]
MTAQYVTCTPAGVGIVCWALRSVLALLAGLVLLGVILFTQGVERAGIWASLLGAGLAIAGAFVTLVTWWVGQHSATGGSRPDRIR